MSNEENNPGWEAPDGTRHENKEAATRYVLQFEIEALFSECEVGGTFCRGKFFALLEKPPLRAMFQEYLDTYGREPGRTLNQSEEG